MNLEYPRKTSLPFKISDFSIDMRPNRQDIAASALAAALSSLAMARFRPPQGWRWTAQKMLLQGALIVMVRMAWDGWRWGAWNSWSFLWVIIVLCVFDHSLFEMRTDKTLLNRWQDQWRTCKLIWFSLNSDSHQFILLIDANMTNLLDLLSHNHTVVDVSSASTEDNQHQWPSLCLRPCGPLMIFVHGKTCLQSVKVLSFPKLNLLRC